MKFCGSDIRYYEWPVKSPRGIYRTHQKPLQTTRPLRISRLLLSVFAIIAFERGKNF